MLNSARADTVWRAPLPRRHPSSRPRIRCFAAPWSRSAVFERAALLASKYSLPRCEARAIAGRAHLAVSTATAWPPATLQHTMAPYPDDLHETAYVIRHLATPGDLSTTCPYCGIKAP